MSDTIIQKTLSLNASREDVWKFLTDKDKLGEWYHPAENHLTKDEDYSLYKVDENDQKVPLITGTVLEFDPPSKLVTTFVIGPFGDNETTVTWLLEEDASGTKLSLTHEGIAEASGDNAAPLLAALDKGWDEHLARMGTASTG